MPEVTSVIQCKTRSFSGKGEAHKLRAAGLTPAIAYGARREPLLLALDPHRFRLQRAAYGISFIYDVEIDGGDTFKALIKDIQLDPVSRELLHVDLYAVDMSKPIRVEVPLELTGKPAGATEGGILSQLTRRLVVQCLPDRVPAKLTADVTEMKIAQVLTTAAIKLPEGVTFVARKPEPIATVIVPAEEEVAVPEVTLEPGAEGAVPAEGAAAAPAEGAAAAAAPGADGKAAPAAKADAKGGDAKPEGKGGDAKGKKK